MAKKRIANEEVNRALGEADKTMVEAVNFSNRVTTRPEGQMTDALITALDALHQDLQILCRAAEAIAESSLAAQQALDSSE